MAATPGGDSTTPGPSLPPRRIAIPDSNVVLTAIEQADPPSLWALRRGESMPRPTFDVVGRAASWAHVREAFLPVPDGDRERVTINVCVPVYSEDGFTLTRTIEALALQRDDMHRAFAYGSGIRANEIPCGERQPELHVLAIFDGYDVTVQAKDEKGAVVERKRDIMAKSMREAVNKLYGGVIDFKEIEAMFAEGAEHVLIQHAVPTEVPVDTHDATPSPQPMPAALAHPVPSGAGAMPVPPTSAPIPIAGGKAASSAAALSLPPLYPAGVGGPHAGSSSLGISLPPVPSRPIPIASLNGGARREPPPPPPLLPNGTAARGSASSADDRGAAAIAVNPAYFSPPKSPMTGLATGGDVIWGPASTRTSAEQIRSPMTAAGPISPRLGASVGMGGGTGGIGAGLTHPSSPSSAPRPAPAPYPTPMESLPAIPDASARGPVPKQPSHASPNGHGRGGVPPTVAGSYPYVLAPIMVDCQLAMLSHARTGGSSTTAFPSLKLDHETIEVLHDEAVRAANAEWKAADMETRRVRLEEEWRMAEEEGSSTLYSSGRRKGRAGSMDDDRATLSYFPHRNSMVSGTGLRAGRRLSSHSAALAVAPSPDFDDGEVEGGGIGGGAHGLSRSAGHRLRGMTRGSSGTGYRVVTRRRNESVGARTAPGSGGGGTVGAASGKRGAGGSRSLPPVSRSNTGDGALDDRDGGEEVNGDHVPVPVEHRPLKGEAGGGAEEGTATSGVERNVSFSSAGSARLLKSALKKRGGGGRGGDDAWRMGGRLYVGSLVASAGGSQTSMRAPRGIMASLHRGAPHAPGLSRTVLDARAGTAALARHLGPRVAPRIELTRTPSTVLGGGGGGADAINATGGGTVITQSTPVSSRLPIYFSVLIKKTNAKKHHSHRWFFEAFCQVARLYHGSPNLQYFFCTDVGTLYTPGMLARLSKHMQRNPHCAACCAHQRIMSYTDQADPSESEAEGPFQAGLRNVQAFDFESGLAIFNGVHAALGFLPVIPGPCGLFRANAVTASILEDVRLICTNPSTRDGIIQGNLKIAEDRILSYLLLLVPGPGGRQYETHWVPSTTFFFESEDDLNELVPQRRRWLNGTVAGYLWLLTNSKLWRGMFSLGLENDVGEVYRAPRLMPWKVFMLCLLQLLIFLIVYLMPAFMPVTGHLAMYGLAAVMATWGVPLPDPLLTTMLVLFWLVYFGSFGALTITSRWGKTAVIKKVWYTRVCINAFIMLLNAFVMVSLIITSNLYPDSLAPYIPISDQSDLRIAFASAILYTASPFLLTLMHSWASFKMMIGCFASYFIFLPTILSDFFAYSVARLDDWRWGTKAVDAGKAADTTVNAKDQRDARGRLALITNIAFGLQLGLAATGALVNIVLRDVVKHYLIGVGAATAGVGMSTMFLSFLYFFFRAGTKCLTCNMDVSHLEAESSRVKENRICAAVVETVLKLFTFFGWAAATTALIYIAMNFNSVTELTSEAELLILLVLGLVLVIAAVRWATESCASMAVQEAMTEAQLSKRTMRNRVAVIEEQRRRDFRLRGVSGCCAVTVAMCLMPLSFIGVLVIFPINAFVRACRNLCACLVWCCCRPSDRRVTFQDGSPAYRTLPGSRASWTARRGGKGGGGEGGALGSAAAGALGGSDVGGPGDDDATETDDGIALLTGRDKMQLPTVATAADVDTVALELGSEEDGQGGVWEARGSGGDSGEGWERGTGRMVRARSR